jgi:hypothetical protein
MLEITKVEYKEDISPILAMPPYRYLLFHVRLPDQAKMRFLVDQEGIRTMDVPAMKGAIPRSSVDKVVIRHHAGHAFSVAVFLHQGIAQRMRSHLLAILHGVSPSYPEEIGTAFGGVDASQVTTWLQSLGYTVLQMLVNKEPVYLKIHHIIAESIAGADWIVDPALAKGISQDEVAAQAIVDGGLELVPAAIRAGANRKQLLDAVLHALESYGSQHERLQAEAHRQGQPISAILANFVAQAFWSALGV